MPKEYINNRYYGQSGRSHENCDTKGEPHCPPDCAGSSLVALDDSAVKVGWSKDLEHVEIAVIHHRDGAGDGDPNCWHSQFDRDGINTLIRTLRKARDAAYGSYA
jgi:hypothetical protein